MLKAFILTGLPASGKSTWIENSAMLADCNPIIVSSDNYIDTVAARLGKTYNDVFKDAIKDATNHVKNQKAYAIENERDIVWDQTNLTVKKRKQCLEGLDKYQTISVDFSIPSLDIWFERLGWRVGKTIPYHIMGSMIKSYEKPTIDEGFHSIIRV